MDNNVLSSDANARINELRKHIWDLASEKGWDYVEYADAHGLDAETAKKIFDVAPEVSIGQFLNALTFLENCLPTLPSDGNVEEIEPEYSPFSVEDESCPGGLRRLGWDELTPEMWSLLDGEGVDAPKP